MDFRLHPRQAPKLPATRLLRFSLRTSVRSVTPHYPFPPLAPSTCARFSDLSLLFSNAFALFSATEDSQRLPHQSLPHSFPCNGGVSLCPPLPIRRSPQFPCKFAPLFPTTSKMLLPHSLLFILWHGCPGVRIPSLPWNASAHANCWASLFPTPPLLRHNPARKGTVNLNLARGGSR